MTQPIQYDGSNDINNIFVREAKGSIALVKVKEHCHHEHRQIPKGTAVCIGDWFLLSAYHVLRPLVEGNSRNNHLIIIMLNMKLKRLLSCNCYMLLTSYITCCYLSLKHLLNISVFENVQLSVESFVKELVLFSLRKSGIKINKLNETYP